MKTALVVLSGALALATPPGFSEILLPFIRSGPAGLAWGYDGRMYGVENDRNKFFRLDAAQNKVTAEWPLPTIRDGAPVVALPGRVFAGGTGGIAVLDTRAGKVSEVLLPGVSVTGLAVDQANGVVYFTDAHTGAISKLVGRKTTPLAVLNPKSGRPCIPYGIVFDPRTKAVFVGCQGSNEIWRVNPDGKATAYGIPSPNSLPEDFVLGRDGKIYAALFDAGAVAQLDPASGRVETLPLPSASKLVGARLRCIGPALVRPAGTQRRRLDRPDDAGGHAVRSDARRRAGDPRAGAARAALLLGPRTQLGRRVRAGQRRRRRRKSLHA